MEEGETEVPLYYTGILGVGGGRGKGKGEGREEWEGYKCVVHKQVHDKALHTHTYILYNTMHKCIPIVCHT